MRKLLFMLLMLFSGLAFGATVNKPVTTLGWTNPSTNTSVTSVLVTCGTLTYSATAAADIAAGQPASVPLSSVITADGTYTCTVAPVDANGTAAPSNSTPTITATSGVFTVVVTVPDAVTDLTVQ